jgi:putative aldouronate transport system substrate-binding protein
MAGCLGLSARKYLKEEFMKKIICVALAITLVASFAMAQNKPVTGNGPAVKAPANRGTVIDTPFYAKKPIKVSMLFSDSPYYPYKDTWTVFKSIKTATNVEIDPMLVPQSEFSNKRNLLLSSGDAPYIICKTYAGSEVPFIASGSVLPISDYINEMPNFKAAVKAWGMENDIKNILTQADGKYYMLPGMHETFAMDYSYVIRTDILKKLNLPLPQTYDELLTTLRALKKAYPDVIPYNDRWQLGWALQVAGPAFGCGLSGVKAVNDWNNNFTLIQNDKTKALQFYATTDAYKNELKYFANLVKEGLLDPESCTQQDDPAITKFVNGQSFLIAGNGQELARYRTKMDAILGAGKYEIAQLNILGGPAGRNLMGNRLESGIMLTAKIKKDPNFKEILHFIDWLFYSYSGQELCKWGVEGTTYTFSNGQYAPAAGWCLPSYGFNAINAADKDFRVEFGYSSGNIILSYGGPKQLQYSLMPAEKRAFVEQVNKAVKILPVPPTVLYDEDQLETQNMLRGPLMDYVYQMTYKFILGQADIDKDWGTYVKECSTKGADKFVKTANEVYAKQIKK